MQILITGGAGFIGSNLVEHHLKSKDEVYVVDNLLTGSQENLESLLTYKELHFIEDDVITYNFSDLPQFDIVYHLASPASPIQYKKYPVETLRVNAEGTYRLLEFVKKSPQTSFVLASTSEVYGDPLEHPQTEDYFGNVNSVGVRSCYDEAKRYAEALSITYFRKYHLNIRIARIFNTYGPRMEKDDGRVVSNFIVQSLTRQPITIYGNGKQTRSFCYVSDMVKALNLLATTKNIAGEIINIGNPEEKSMLELAHLVKQLTGSQSAFKHEEIAGDDPKKRKPDISKAKKLLGWTPDVNLKDGLLKTIQYFKKRYI